MKEEKKHSYQEPKIIDVKLTDCWGLHIGTQFHRVIAFALCETELFMEADVEGEQDEIYVEKELIPMIEENGNVRLITDIYPSTRYKLTTAKIE